MSLKSKLKSFKKIPLVLLVWNERRRIIGNKQIKKTSDEEFILKEYRSRTGHELNLANPTRFTEKLQWLKLFYRDDNIKVTTDKYTVREYLKNKGYEHILNDLIGAYDTPDDIDFNSLPDKFVLKLSHGSGWNIICKDKSRLNLPIYKLIIKSWMKQNLYIYGREWNYKDLEPKIIIEKYLDNNDGQLTDYKFFCFNGKPHFVQIDHDRFSHHKQTYYDMNWRILNVQTGHETLTEDCPQNFEEMKSIATELSKPFPHVRIDFYNVNNKIYFGEFTYFDGSGFYTFEPDNTDFAWGKLLELPKPNYNLDLLKTFTVEKLT